MKRYFWVIALTIIATTGCNAPSSSVPSVQPDNEEITYANEVIEEENNDQDKSLIAYNAYVDYLGDSCENMEAQLGFQPKDSTFIIKDINEDDVSEMIIMMTDFTEQNIAIISCDDASHIKVGYLPDITYMDIITPNNYIGTYTHEKYGGFTYKYYKFKNDCSLELLCYYQESLMANSDSEDNPLNQQYFIGSNEVSQDEYSEYVINTIGDSSPNTLKANDGTIELYNCTPKNFSRLRKGNLK